MARYLRLCIVVLAVGIIVSGCVSTGKYKKMETGKNQEIAALQQEKTSLDSVGAGAQALA